jgi:hypothetical protein
MTPKRLNKRQAALVRQLRLLATCIEDFRAWNGEGKMKSWVFEAVIRTALRPGVAGSFRGGPLSPWGTPSSSRITSRSRADSCCAVARECEP